MTRPASDSFLITPSLLNSWGYIWSCRKAVREAESDLVSIEDKRDEASDKAFGEFLKTLNREPIPDNEYMKRGREYEEATYRGETRASPFVLGGRFQVVGKKKVVVDGLPFLMYGRLDCLKGGIISDIKRVSAYKPPKYLDSWQHGFYLELFPEAYKFEYLADDGNALHVETYYRDQCRKTESGIREFLLFLKQYDLLGTYLEKWGARKE